MAWRPEEGAPFRGRRFAVLAREDANAVNGPGYESAAARRERRKREEEAGAAVTRRTSWRASRGAVIVVAAAVVAHVPLALRRLDGVDGEVHRAGALERDEKRERAKADGDERDGAR